MNGQTKGETWHTKKRYGFKALKLGWSFETIGSHIIRNNTIKNYRADWN